MSIIALEKLSKNITALAQTESILSQKLESSAGEHVKIDTHQQKKQNISTVSVLPKILDTEKAIFSQMYQAITTGSIDTFFMRDIRTFHGRGEISREGWESMCVECVKMRTLYDKVAHVHPLSVLSWISSEPNIKENLKKIHGYTKQWARFPSLIDREIWQFPNMSDWLNHIKIPPWNNIVANFKKSMEALYNTEELCTDAFLETMPQSKRKRLEQCIQNQKYEKLFKKVLEI